MKKIAAVAALLALSAVLVGCNKTETAQPAAPAAPAALTKIVVGLDDNFPPMGFRDEKNELVGFDIDMAREASKRLGVEVEFKPIDWSAKEAELSGKRVDALRNGLTITEERKQNILFTAPDSAFQCETRASASTRPSGTASNSVMKNSFSVTVAPCASGPRREST